MRVQAAALRDLEADCVGWPLGVRPAVQFANKSVRLAAEVRPLSPNRPSECRRGGVGGGGAIGRVTHKVFSQDYALSV